MEHREPYSYVGLDLYHKHLSTRAQQIMKAIQYDHKRMQNPGKAKYNHWNHDMEEITTDGCNRRKTGTGAVLQEVEYWQNEERIQLRYPSRMEETEKCRMFPEQKSLVSGKVDKVVGSAENEQLQVSSNSPNFWESKSEEVLCREDLKCVQLQSLIVTRQQINIPVSHTRFYSENQAARSYEDRFVNSLQSYQDTAVNFQVVKQQEPRVSGNRAAQVPQKAVFQIKNALVSKTQENDSYPWLASNSTQYTADSMVPGGKEASKTNTSFWVRHGTKDCTSLCWDESGSVQNDQHLEQQSNMAVPHPLSVAQPKKLLTSDERLNSLQDKNAKCLKRKLGVRGQHGARPSKAASLKLPADDSTCKNDGCQDDSGAERMDSGKLRARAQICDVCTLDTKQRSKVLEEVERASFIILTMVYQDGSSQLTAVKESISSVVSSILALLMNQSGGSSSLTYSEGTASDDALLEPHQGGKYFHLKLEQSPTWLKQDPNDREFVRVLLLHILSRKGCIVCFKAKDLLRTVLHYCTDSVSLKQASEWEILDPRIAAWLLDPNDTASCFETLIPKYCGRSSLLETTGSTADSFGHPKVSLHAADFVW
uniref:DNA polymerase nu pseudo-exo domain-containing protein n=1 Tax=Callorhinchus milii TaxID=7868 RepID=A0A4W3J8W9_CALMI